MESRVDHPRCRRHNSNKRAMLTKKTGHLGGTSEQGKGRNNVVSWEKKQKRKGTWQNPVVKFKDKMRKERGNDVRLCESS